MADNTPVTYKGIKKEIGKVFEQLMEMRKGAEPLKLAKIDRALHDLEVANFTLNCGQTQSPVDAGPLPPGTLASGLGTAPKGQDGPS